MAAAALLALFLLGGSGTLDVAIFTADTDKVLREVIKDTARAREAVDISKRQHDQMEDVLKRASKVMKEFGKADRDQAAGLDKLEPFLASLSEERSLAEKQTLDSVFALRKTMTEAEWNAAFNRPRK
jgi:hypothetical protein